MIKFDRDIYFATIKPLFGKFTQDQVDGQEAILTRWELGPGVVNDDIRHPAYCLATTYHETSKEMQPIEEYNKGAGQPYGVPDPETGQTYYGRGFVQLTWRDNYRRATEELELSDANDLEWHAAKALDLDIAAQVMFEGMEEGWFRSDSGGRQTLNRYFSDTVDDPYTAREIINGDKHIVPSWSNGVSIGNLIKGYHQQFLAALEASVIEVAPEPEPEIPTVTITIKVTGNVKVEIREEE